MRYIHNFEFRKVYHFIVFSLYFSHFISLLTLHLCIATGRYNRHHHGQLKPKLEQRKRRASHHHGLLGRCQQRQQTAIRGLGLIETTLPHIKKYLTSKMSFGCTYTGSC